MPPTGVRVFNDINDLAKSLQVFLPIITHYNPQKLQTNFVQGDIVLNLRTLSPAPNIALSHLFNMTRGIT